jgi:hypothetical protein
MSERGLPELGPAALRDHGSDERIERVWRRLESEFGAHTARPRAALWWAPAALVIVFGAGVFVGAHWRGAEVAGSTLPVLAEPPSAEAAGPAQTPFRLLPAPNLTELPKRERKSPVLGPGPEPPVADAPVLTVPAVPVSPPVIAVPQTLASPDWQRLANVGDYTGASRAVEKQGGFDAVFPTASPEQLMTLYEVARASGQRTRAVQALRQVFERYPGDENAADAAYTLGNLLEKDGDKAGAAGAFEAYRRLSPKGDFAEDALARQFESAVERGDHQAARQYADQYAKDFPKGRRLAAIKKQLAKLSGAPQPAESAPDDAVEDEAEEVAPPPTP